MILFLHGSDTYRSRQKLKELKDKFIKEVDPQGYNLSLLLGSDTTISAVMEAAMASPFMADKRMVILEELSALKMSDKEEAMFIEIVGTLLEQDTIFVVWEGALGKRDLKKKIFKAIQQTKYIIPFEAWNAQQVAGWMAQELTNAEITIGNDALQSLSLAVDDDLWKAQSETKKLIAYCKGNQRNSLDNEAIKLMIAGGSQDNIFALVDAVSQANTKDALMRLHDQLKSGSHELEILSMLMRQYRILQQVKDGLDKGMAPDQIAQSFGLHPFVAKKMSGQARKFSQEQLSVAYERLTTLDKMIKSSGLSGKTLASITVGHLAS
jgi:DNA polymerase III subunit delta